MFPAVKKNVMFSIIRATIIRETKFKLLRQVYVDE
jgi:hypothetical protein